MSPDGAITDPSLNRAEHDANNSAKRVLPLGWNGTQGIKQAQLATGWFLKPMDTLTASLVTLQDTWQSSLSGVVADTVVITYTDLTKATIVNVVRS